MFLFRAGCRAMLKQFNGTPDAEKVYMEWEEQLMKSLRGADRQTEEFFMYPTQSIMGGSGQSISAAGIGAAWPYGYQPLGY